MNNKKIVYINSKNKTSGTHSNFYYNINLKKTDYTHVVVLSAQLPKSYYMIQNNLNTFTLEEDGKEATITIPAGNYNRKNLKSTLETLLNASSPNTWTYAISIPTAPDTGYYTFSVSGNSSVQPSFIFTSYLSEQLGFENDTTYNFVGDALTSVNVINLQKESTLFLHSSLVGTGENNILLELYANSADFDYITYNCGDVEAYSKEIVSNNADTHNFYLTNEDDIEMNLNGQNINFTLLFYQKDQTNDLVQKFIKYMVSQNE